MEKRHSTGLEIGKKTRSLRAAPQRTTNERSMRVALRILGAVASLMTSVQLAGAGPVPSGRARHTLEQALCTHTRARGPAHCARSAPGTTALRKLGNRWPPLRHALLRCMLSATHRASPNPCAPISCQCASCCGQPCAGGLYVRRTFGQLRRACEQVPDRCVRPCATAHPWLCTQARMCVHTHVCLCTHQCSRWLNIDHRWPQFRIPQRHSHGGPTARSSHRVLDNIMDIKHSCGMCIATAHACVCIDCEHCDEHCGPPFHIGLPSRERGRTVQWRCAHGPFSDDLWAQLSRARIQPNHAHGMGGMRNNRLGLQHATLLLCTPRQLPSTHPSAHNCDNQWACECWVSSLPSFPCPSAARPSSGNGPF